MAGVHEVGWGANHRPVYSYPSLFARIACLFEAAAEALDPEFVHFVGEMKLMEMAKIRQRT